MRTLHLSYALSGLISLGYQVFWLRHFVDRFGSSTFTFVLVISCFIAGLSAGALASPRLTAGMRRLLGGVTPLTVYGVFELLIALTALLVFVEALLPVDLLGSFPYVLRDGIFEPSVTYQLVKAPLAAASIFVPCFFMGVTFPLLCDAFAERSRLPSSLYAWNTLGACSAVLVCEFVLIRFLGTDRTFLLLVLVNVALGLGFVLLGRRLYERERSGSARLAGEARAGSRPREAGTGPLPIALGVALAGAIVSGFLSGALEADAFRRIHFIQISNGAAMAFVSFWAIAAIFLGSALIHGRTRWRLAHIQVAYVIGFAAYLLITRFALTPAHFWVKGVAESTVGGSALDPDGRWTILLAELGVVGLVTFPPYFCVSLLLPYLCNRIQAQGRHLGLVYGLNTAAFLVGMAAFSWIAPRVNMFYAFRLATLFFLVLVVFTALLREASKLRSWSVAATVGSLGMIAVFTPATFDRSLFPPSNPLHQPEVEIRALEGSTGFTSFVATLPWGDTLFLDTVMMSGVRLSAVRYMKLMAHFPLLLQTEPRSALLICFGVGNTASAMAKHDTLEQIDIVDLSRNILETAPQFEFHNDRVFGDPRVRMIHDDGRSFLSVTDQRYDLITSEPPPPLMEGISRLYSKEYYEAALEHLTPRGCMTQWLPIYQMPAEAGRLIVRTFVRVFPETLLFVGFENELVLIGSPSPIDLAVLARRFDENPAVAGDLSDIGMPTPVHLLARIMLSDAGLRQAHGRGEVISDQNNQLSVFWPAGRMLVFPISAREVLAALPDELSGPGSELVEALTDLRQLRRVVPDHSAESMAQAGPDDGFVAGTEVDWIEFRDLNQAVQFASSTGRLDVAWNLLERSLSILPAQRDMLLLRAEMLLDSGRTTQAVQAYRRCVELFPEHAAVHYRLALALNRAGEPGEAIASLNTALELNPRGYESHLQLSDLLRRMGDRKGAARHQRKALRFKPALDGRGSAIPQR